MKLEIAIQTPLREAGEINPDALTTSSASTNPTELIGALPEVDRLTLPTGTEIFRCGDHVQSIYVVERGLVELFWQTGPGHLGVSWDHSFPAYRSYGTSRAVTCRVSKE